MEKTIDIRRYAEAKRRERIRVPTITFTEDDVLDLRIGFSQGVFRLYFRGKWENYADAFDLLDRVSTLVEKLG